MSSTDEETALHPTGPRYQGNKSATDAETNFFQKCQEHHRSLLFTCFICLVVLGEGYDIGVLNGAAVLIKKEFGFTAFQISFIITLTAVGVALGVMLGGTFADACGRKGALQTTCVFLVVGPLSMAFAQGFWWLVIGRLICGVGVGGGICVVGIYIMETCPAEMRGKFTLLEEMFLSLGVLLGFASNYALVGIENDWRWMLAAGALLPAIIFVCLFIPSVPESPRWLFMHGRLEESKSVLNYFLSPYEVKVAWENLTKARDSGGGKFSSWGELISGGDPVFWKALRAALIVGVGQALCGYVPLTYYSTMIMATEMPVKQALLASNAMGAVKLVFLLVAIMLMDRCGRRRLLLLSTVLTVVSCAWLAFSFAFHWSWLAIGAGFSFFMASVGLGIGVVWLLYIPEVFRNEHRGKGASAALLASRVFTILWLGTFPWCIETLSISITFCLQGALNVVVLVLVWLFVPETAGRTLEDVHSLFHKPMISPRSHDLTWSN